MPVATAILTRAWLRRNAKICLGQLDNFKQMSIGSSSLWLDWFVLAIDMYCFWRLGKCGMAFLKRKSTPRQSNFEKH
jgi:hypothetical protein